MQVTLQARSFIQVLSDVMHACQALVNAGLDVDLNSSTVNDLVLGATQTAEKHHQGLIALHVLTAGKRSFEYSWQQMLRLLENAERSTSGREDVKSALMSGAILNGATIRHNFESELARALLALWLYFDLKCADSADHVRGSSLLLILLLPCTHMMPAMHAAHEKPLTPVVLSLSNLMAYGSQHLKENCGTAHSGAET